MMAILTSFLSAPSDLGWAFLTALLSYCLYVHYVHNKLHGYLPGPRPIPFLGNVHQFALEYQERRIFDWGRTFGDIIYTRFFSRHAILINSPQVAQVLLEKRRGNYCDRPPTILQGELMGWDQMLVFMRYGDRFRKMRKWTHEAFMARTALCTYREIQKRETYILLKGLSDSSDKFVDIFTRFTAATLMEIAYGHTVKSDEDEYIDLADRAATETVEAGNPGSMLVDFFPILKYYPIWLPGSGWKRNAFRIQKLGQRMINEPYKMVKKLRESGEAKPSFVSSLLERYEGNPSPEDENDIKCAAGVLYGAGTETTANVFTAFMLAMTMYPRVFNKAQAEMDRVVGRDRLPDFEDRQDLHYLDCLIREVYRWHPPTPLGIPHYSIKDDEYNGHNIPGKSIIITNIWGMTRDPEVFPDPEIFLPERFETEEWKEPEKHSWDPRSINFGFGRRKCPAQNFADSNVYLVLAHIIATMTISKAKDEDGADITPNHHIKSGFVHHIEPFRTCIRPRSPQTAELIMSLNANIDPGIGSDRISR